jgi:hypothetical protein
VGDRLGCGHPPADRAVREGLDDGEALVG